MESGSLPEVGEGVVCFGCPVVEDDFPGSFPKGVIGPNESGTENLPEVVSSSLQRYDFREETSLSLISNVTFQVRTGPFVKYSSPITVKHVFSSPPLRPLGKEMIFLWTLEPVFPC